MRIAVRLEGVERAQKQLEDLGRSVAPIVRGSLNTSAVSVRRHRYVKQLNSSIKSGGRRGAKTNIQRIRIMRANSNHSNARIIPAGSGIPVPNYKSWGYEVIDATRARIWVMGPNRRKIAAGFVNPSSLQRLPWMTRRVKRTAKKTYNDKKALQTAYGPSVAYWFKELTPNQPSPGQATFCSRSSPGAYRKKFSSLKASRRTHATPH